MTERDADDQLRAHFDQRAADYDGWWLGTGSFTERERPGVLVTRVEYGDGEPSVIKGRP